MILVMQRSCGRATSPRWCQNIMRRSRYATNYASAFSWRRASHSACSTRPSGRNYFCGCSSCWWWVDLSTNMRTWLVPTLNGPRRSTSHWFLWESELRLERSSCSRSSSRWSRWTQARLTRRATIPRTCYTSSSIPVSELSMLLPMIGRSSGDRTMIVPCCIDYWWYWWWLDACWLWWGIWVAIIS